MREHSDSRPVVIVGAGYSGTLAAVNLLRESRGEALRVILIERQAAFGRGLAYRAADDGLLLNVPAGNMSALADDADDFLRYCRTLDANIDGGSFVPRRIYGDYLEQVLARTEAEYPGALERVAGEAVAVRRLPDSGFEVQLADGRSWQAAQVVLAFGHAPPKPAWPATQAPGYIHDPWDFDALHRVSPAAPVLILGAGHTAIDALLQLAAGNHERKFFLLSRRGLLPQPHRALPKQPMPAGFPAYLQDLPATLRALSRALRAEIAARQAAGGDWRDVINALRPHTPALWQRLPLQERKRFLRHIGAYWDIHRHRLAPAVHAQLQDLLTAGKVEVIAGRPLAYEQLGSGIKVTIRERRTSILRELTAGAVVNCTGPNYDLDTLASPLVVQLRNASLLQRDPLHIGLEVDDRYQILDRQGKAAHGLYYLGPMLRAGYWEATAVPELRSHALRLARQLLADRHPASATVLPG